jgi:O-antigen/teichoic acid export membrane protein
MLIKSIFRGWFNTVIIVLLSGILGLININLSTKFLNSYEFSVYSLLISIGTWVQLMDFGYSQSVENYIIRQNNFKNIFAFIIKRNFLIMGILILILSISIISGYFSTTKFKYIGLVKEYLYISLIYILGVILSTSINIIYGAIRGLNKSTLVAGLIFLKSINITFLLILSKLNNLSFYYYIYILLLTSILIDIIAYLYVLLIIKKSSIRSLIISDTKKNNNSLRSHHFFSNQISSIIIISSTPILVSYNFGVDLVGGFKPTLSLIGFIIGILTISARAINPILSNENIKFPGKIVVFKKIIISLVILFGFTLGIIYYLLSPIFINIWVGKNFILSESINVCLAIFLASTVMMIYSSGLLVSINKTFYLYKINIFFITLFLVISTLMSQLHGVNGFYFSIACVSSIWTIGILSLLYRTK